MGAYEWDVKIDHKWYQAWHIEIHLPIIKQNTRWLQEEDAMVQQDNATAYAGHGAPNMLNSDGRDGR